MGSVKRARFIQSSTNTSWSEAKVQSDDLLLRTSIVSNSGAAVKNVKQGQKRGRSERAIQHCRKVYDLRSTVLSNRSYLDVEDVILPSVSCIGTDLCSSKPIPPQSDLDSLQTIVINLDHRPDRMATVTENLNAQCPGLPFSRFSASNGSKTPIGSAEVTHSWNTSQNTHYQRLRSIRKGWDDLDTYHECNLKMSGGERGCASSHIRAWRHCIEESSASGQENRPLLVLEDDAEPTPEFAATLRRALADLPKDAHVLYLGYSQAAEWRREVTADLVESEYVWTTVGYIIWPAGARILLSNLPVNAPVDNWMAGRCATNEIKAYCVRPKIIRQAEGWNVNSDVSHSDENSWDPDVYEPLVVVGSMNEWNMNTAKVCYRFDHTNASDTTAQTQESMLSIKCDGTQMSFQIASARKLWDFRLYPKGSEETRYLDCDNASDIEVCLMVGKDHNVASGKNFLINSANCSDGFVTIRVSQNRDQFRIWLEKDSD